MDLAYGFSGLQAKGTTGSNQTIVIDDACGDPTIQSDLKAFDTQFGLPAPKLKVIHPQGTPCTDSSWAVETALDVEWSHVTAPGAAIDLLEAAVPNTTDVYGAWTYAINHQLGNQISNSFGGAGCYSQPACNATIGQGIGGCNSVSGTAGVNVTAILNKASRDHITVLASAGDSGAWGQGTANTEPIPADCSGVLTVGGTTLSVSSTGAYVSEKAWSGTGGGYTNQSEPRYQKSVKISDKYHSLAKPDVAADADPSTGVWIYEQGWGTVGGTSVSCPLWAGFMADVNEVRAGNGLGPRRLREFVPLRKRLRGPGQVHELHAQFPRHQVREQRMAGRDRMGRRYRTGLLPSRSVGGHTRDQLNRLSSIRFLAPLLLLGASPQKT